MSSNRNNDQACAEYFKNQKTYQRCFRELWKKWRSYGKPAGRITLKHTSGEERRGIGGITGKVFYEEDICFTFSEFEQGLQKTRFAPVDMKKVLEAISKGCAGSWQMDNRSETMLEGKFNFGFAVDWMRKDLRIVLAEAARNGSKMPLTTMVEAFYGDLQKQGDGRLDTSSLIKLLPIHKA